MFTFQPKADTESHISTNSEHTMLTINHIDPLGYSKSRVWDGDMNIDIYTNENGNSWTYTYDGYSNMLTETDPLGYTSELEWETIDTEDEYIALLKNLTDANGHRTQYYYGGM